MKRLVALTETPSYNTKNTHFAYKYTHNNTQTTHIIVEIIRQIHVYTGISIKLNRMDIFTISD